MGVADGRSSAAAATPTSVDAGPATTGSTIGSAGAAVVATAAGARAGPRSPDAGPDGATIVIGGIKTAPTPGSGTLAGPGTAEPSAVGRIRSQPGRMRLGSSNERVPKVRPRFALQRRGHARSFPSSALAIDDRHSPRTTT